MTDDALAAALTLVEKEVLGRHHHVLRFGTARLADGKKKRSRSRALFVRLVFLDAVKRSEGCPCNSLRRDIGQGKVI